MGNGGFPPFYDFGARTVASASERVAGQAETAAMDAIPTCGTIRRSTAVPPKSGDSRWSRRPSAAVVVSEFGLLREDQGIVYLNPEVPDRALQLRVTEQELAGP